MSTTVNDTTASPKVPSKVDWTEAKGPFPMDSEEANDINYYAKTKYKGFEVPERQWCLPRRNLDHLTKDEFFHKYVRPRKPVVLYTNDPLSIGLRGFLGKEKWSYDYLRQQAGDLDARIETRSGPEEGYGKGKSQQMKFGEFLVSADPKIMRHESGSVS